MQKLVRFVSVLGLICLLAILPEAQTQGRTAVGGDNALDPSESAFRFQKDDFAEFDSRIAITPSLAQVNAVAALGATAQWSAFGTPLSLVRQDNQPLAQGLTGAAATAVRGWLRSNRELFRLSDADVSALELVHDTQLVNSTARSLLFRQTFGNLKPIEGGLISVGYREGNIYFVSATTVAWNGVALGAPALSAVQAWQRAAADLDRTVALNAINFAGLRQDWTLIQVVGFAQQQMARLRVFPTAQGPKLVYDTVVLNVKGLDALAVSHVIDANTGAVLFRHNRKQSADGTLGATTVDVDAPQVAPETRTFTGAYVPPACGPYHIFNVTPGKTSITTAAGTVNPANDIKLTLFYSNTLLNQYQEVASADTATSPEQITYQPVGGVIAGDYAVQVCPFPGAAQLDPYEYSGAFTTDDGQTGTGVVVNPLADTPRFRYFRANPPLDNSTADTRTTACMTPGVNGALPEGCTLQLRTSLLQSTWDTDVSSGTSTGTTIGNNAQTAQSWYSQLTPSAPYRPTSVNRTYVYPWTNAWNTARCNPSVLTPPNGNDTDAATANLFALHNLMHDWSYFLGFTETAYNMQTNNRGQGGTAADPEIGNVQAAAVDGGSPQYVGRDNANQVTLQDGTPGISNMYLWQPIAGAFYAPCVDGDYDMSVVGHEYGHGIQNRMAGGPDDGLSGQQGRSMGESWADLTAVEFLNGFNLLPTATESPFAVGPYVTGNGYRGIRSYNMSESPLNYANLEYDGGGTTSPHADGEIWSATNFDIRQSLMNKYNAQFPANDVNAQYLCASGQRSAELCPGNRRWIQIMHDAFLLQPGSTSMLTARDAYLAADMMRFGGANQPELWTAFARRGMGVNASSPTPSYANNGADNVNATPDYSVPPQFGNNATITFQAVASDQAGTPAVDALVFVGDYEARAMPIADTNPTTAFTGTLIRPFDATTMMQSVSVPFSFAISPTAKFVPGTYQFTVTGRGYGTAKLSLTFAPGETRTVVLPLQTNLASATQGASVTSNGTATIDKNVAKLIDDTEETNFARLGTSVAEMLATRLTVDLKGAVQLVRRVQISTVQRPQDSRDAGGDTGGQSRFSTLRQFELLSCNAAAGADCANQDNFSVIYTSPADAFPGNNPRPVVPELDLREFDIPDTLATHLQLHVLQSQCTGGPAYQGEQDNDNLDATDCDTGTVGGQAATAGRRIRIAEFQVYGTEPAAPTAQPATPTTLPTLTATPTSTATGVLPTNTPTRTNTSVPPTNTPTRGATNTATTVPPTNTAVPSPTTAPGATLKLYLPFVRG